MTRIGPRRTPGEMFAEAIDLAERVFPGKFWFLGKGKTRADEPLFGFAVYDKDDPDNPVAEAEHDDPVECVMLAVDAGRGRRQ